MNHRLISALALASLGAQAAAAQTDAVGAGEGAAQQFRRCVSCHQPPDLTFATDRAWLDQVRRTA